MIITGNKDTGVAGALAKIYPDAELPGFSYKMGENPEDPFELHYSSKRGFADLAEGLICSTAKYYGEQFNIERNDWIEGDVHHCLFKIQRIAEA